MDFPLCKRKNVKNKVLQCRLGSISLPEKKNKIIEFPVLQYHSSKPTAVTTKWTESRQANCWSSWTVWKCSLKTVWKKKNLSSLLNTCHTYETYFVHNLYVTTIQVKFKLETNFFFFFFFGEGGGHNFIILHPCEFEITSHPVEHPSSNILVWLHFHGSKKNCTGITAFIPATNYEWLSSIHSHTHTHTHTHSGNWFIHC